MTLKQEKRPKLADQKELLACGGKKLTCKEQLMAAHTDEEDDTEAEKKA